MSDAHEVEISLEVTHGAQLNVYFTDMPPYSAMLTTSAVHRLPLTAINEAPQQQRTASGDLVWVHYVQMRRVAATPTA